MAQSDWNPQKWDPMAENEHDSDEETITDESREAIEVEEEKHMAHLIITQKIKICQ